MKFQFPTGNQLIATAITMVCVNFIVKMLPANVQNLFRV